MFFFIILITNEFFVYTRFRYWAKPLVIRKKEAVEGRIKRLDVVGKWLDACWITVGVLLEKVGTKGGLLRNCWVIVDVSLCLSI